MMREARQRRISQQARVRRARDSKTLYDGARRKQTDRERRNQSSIIVTIISLVGALITGIVAAIGVFSALDTSQGSITISLVSITPLSSSQQLQTSQNSLWLVTLKIENDGNADIRAEDFESNVVLTFEGLDFIDIRDDKGRVTLEKGQAVVLTPQALPSGESFSFTLISDSPLDSTSLKSSVKVSGSVANVEEILFQLNSA